MGELAGVILIIFGPMLAAIWKYRKHRSWEHMEMRAAGGAKGPCKWLVQWDHEAATEWAQGLIEDPGSRVLAAVSISGPEKADLVIEICLAKISGEIILDRLIALKQGDIAPIAYEMHGITAEDLAGAQPLVEVMAEVADARGERELMFHNAKFGGDELQKTCKRLSRGGATR